jgi:hypothetical protein
MCGNGPHKSKKPLSAGTEERLSKKHNNASAEKLKPVAKDGGRAARRASPTMLL